MDKAIDAMVKLLPVLVAVFGGLWALFTYVDHSNQTQKLEEARAQQEQSTRLVQAQQPFLTKQLDLYFETAQVVGKLSALEQSDPKWSAAELRFWQLYWSELSMVESREVETAMVAFKNALVKLKESDPAQSSMSTGAALGPSAYKIAHALRASIESNWMLPTEK